MALLHDIQKDLVSGSPEIGPILLKLRLLASRLGSVLLEDWVKHESEGYPADADIPEYRKVSVSHTGTFSGPFGRGVNNAPIPSALIYTFAGEEWVTLELRQSIASIDALIGKNASSTITLNRSDLILSLQGNVYPEWACNSVIGHVSKSALTELKNSVRTKILELTIALERSVPEAAKIVLGPLEEAPMIEGGKTVTSITHQIVHGNVTTINNSGAQSHISVNIQQWDSLSLIKYLTSSGIAENDAKDFAEILSSEAPDGSGEPFGRKAARWITENLKKAASGTWDIGVAAASTVLSEAAKRYYGLA